MESGGYYGTDVTKLSKELGVMPRRLRKQISGWKRSIKEFCDLRYLRKRPPSITLNEFIEIEARMQSNLIEWVLGDIKNDRLSKGLQNLPSSTFYRAMKQTDMYHNVDLSLIASELGISVAGLYQTLNGWSGPESPFNISDIRLFILAWGFERSFDCWNYIATTCKELDRGTLRKLIKLAGLSVDEFVELYDCMKFVTGAPRNLELVP